jgi:hypothetical protein
MEPKPEEVKPIEPIPAPAEPPAKAPVRRKRKTKVIEGMRIFHGEITVDFK